MILFGNVGWSFFSNTEIRMTPDVPDVEKPKVQALYLSIFFVKRLVVDLAIAGNIQDLSWKDESVVVVQLLFHKN